MAVGTAACRKRILRRYHEVSPSFNLMIACQGCLTLKQNSSFCMAYHSRSSMIVTQQRTLLNAQPLSAITTQCR